jgi:hypothetical protein
MWLVPIIARCGRERDLPYLLRLGARRPPPPWGRRLHRLEDRPVWVGRCVELRASLRREEMEMEAQ